MNDYINFLDNYKNKDVSYNDIINIIKINNIEYDINFNKKRKLNNYEIWKNQHEVKNEKFIEQEKIFIDVNINSLQDLLDIVEKFTYQKKYQYNIDLKSLHIIKNELTDLNNMIGMESIKNAILSQLLYFLQKLHINKKGESDYKHTVIYGPPGTGKTEIAQIIGKMYSKIGILKNNIFKKVTRNDLVAGYLGQTALKTTDVIKSCLGGCLFIDEAYSLGNSNDLDSFSKECIDTLCENLSNHKNDLMVIIAGYEEDINNLLFNINKGLDSRFIWRFKIENYTAKNLLDIFEKKLDDINWKLEENIINVKWFEDKMDHFKNFGRDIEKFISNIKIVHAKRIFGKDAECKRLIDNNDIKNGFDEFNKNNNYVKKIIYNLYV